MKQGTKLIMIYNKSLILDLFACNYKGIAETILCNFCYLLQIFNNAYQNNGVMQAIPGEVPFKTQQLMSSGET